jgi:DNA-binding CsgD family transcriptional regulator
MPTSARLRSEDFRAIRRLAGECRDLGDDPIVWRAHLFEQLGALVGAALGLGGELAGCRSGQALDLGTAEWGWENGFNRAAWLEVLSSLRADPAYSTLMNHYLLRLRTDNGVALTRCDCLRDPEWYPSTDYQRIYRVGGFDHSLWCFHSIPGRGGDEFSTMLLFRAEGERDFTARDRGLVREAHAAVAAQIGGALARFAEPSPSALAPRVRQVLRCLLDGDGDKQVAARLRPSTHTVNQYTKAIHRHFGVRSRAELLARWIRRGWGAKCQWDGKP